MEELHGQTMTHREQLIQLQQVEAWHGTLWSHSPHSSEHNCPEITYVWPDTWPRHSWQHFKKQVQAISAALCSDICFCRSENKAVAGAAEPELYIK